MHRHEVGHHAEIRHLAHFNSLFTGRGSRVYDRVMVRLTRRLYRRVVTDLASLGLVAGSVLDVGTGPGTLVREVVLSLEQSPDGITMNVRDDGVGFDTSASFSGHLGLHSMRERVANLAITKP